MTLQIGARLGHYRIVSLLGRGGMADVYQAEDERLGREVALKAVPPEFARDPERVERFEREVRAAAGLSHPNIVTVYEFGQGEGQHFYTMELMPGGDLKERIRAHPDGMPAAEVRSVAAVVARALHYAHKRGFVHRDVKPENILFGEDGTPQLTDFGIARAMSEGTRMTATGMSIGSPHYMSPEQARGLAVDGRSDLYSLGVVIYEMLTGRLPFDAGDTLAVAYAHVNDPVPVLPNELARWQPVVDRLLAKSPEDRYESAGEIVSVLGAEVLSRAPAKRVMPVRREVAPTMQSERSRTRLVEPPKPRRGLSAALAGALLALAVVGIGYLALRDTEDLDRLASNSGGGSEEVRPEQPLKSERRIDLDRAAPEQQMQVPSRSTPLPVLGGRAVLMAKTAPAGVEVLVDGKLVGKTPLERSDIRAGVREVTLRHPHYRTVRERARHFIDGHVVRIQRTLVRGRGRLRVTARPRHAWVEVDGKRLAEGTPVTIESLPAGPLKVTLGAPEHRQLAVDVEVPKNGVTRLERTLRRIPYGALTLDLEPPEAQVRLLDHDSGYRAGMQLPAGSYGVQVTAQGYETAVFTLRHGLSPTRRHVSLRRGVFAEDWTRGAIDRSKWVTYGSPRPRIVGSFKGYPQVFDNNGDPNYESGAVSIKPLYLGAEWVTIEADVYLNFSNPRGCWTGAMIGLTADANVTPSMLERGTGYGLSFTFHAEGDACWATPSEYQRKAWFSGGITDADGSWEKVPAFGVEGTAYANRWSRLRIVINPSNRVSLHMDDKRLWMSAGTLHPALRSGRMLFLGHRSSGSAGKAYIDNLKVWKYKGSRAVDQ